MKELIVNVDASVLRDYMDATVRDSRAQLQRIADEVAVSTASLDDVAARLHLDITDLSASLREIRNGLTTDIINAAKNDSQAVMAASSLDQSIARLSQAMLEVTDAMDIFRQAHTSLSDVVQLSANIASLRDFLATVSAQLLAQSQRIAALELNLKGVQTAIRSAQSQFKTQSLVNLLDVALTARNI